MEKQPIISIKGRNGKLELYKNFIRLSRKTVMGFLTQGLKGDKDIYFNHISSVQIKKPGLTVGYIQFSIVGGNESKGGVFSSIKDENTFAFDGKDNYKKVLDIKEYIEKNKQENLKKETKISNADELEKFFILKEKGVISEDEFLKKKREIFGEE